MARGLQTAEGSLLALTRPSCVPLERFLPSLDAYFLQLLNTRPAKEVLSEEWTDACGLCVLSIPSPLFWESPPPSLWSGPSP